MALQMLQVARQTFLTTFTGV